MASGSSPARSRPVIRAAGRDDVPSICKLLTRLARTLGEDHLMRSTEEDLIREGFGESPRFQVLLAERSGRPVGMTLFFRTFSSWRGRSGVYVQDLYVDPSERGDGLGRRLLAAASAEGKRHGCSHLRLSVAAANAAARGFYRRMGMVERDDEMICQIAGDAFDRLSDEAKA